MAPALADNFCKILLRIAVTLDQELVSLTFFDRVQVLALHVLDDGDFDRLMISERTHDNRHGVKIGKLGRAPAAFAGNDLIGVV